MPVKNAAPSLISNGFDEAIQFHLSDDFVVNAEEDGKVIEINEKLGFIVVQYKSGKVKAISVDTEVVKNSAGGFYLANKLVPTKAKVGDTFKKDEPLAYHDKYFKYSQTNGLRYAMGALAKIAFVSTYNTYEDGGICTASLADKLQTEIVFEEKAMFDKDHDIISIVKIGDKVNIGDSLVKFGRTTEDAELAKYLTKLSEENKRMLLEETKNDIKTKHAGEIVAIKVYSLLEPSKLTPSLGNVVKQYFDRNISKKEYLSKFDKSDGIMKAGYLLTGSTEAIKNKYNKIKNIATTVLIEFYIKAKDIPKVGDKIALYSANKQIISQVIPKNFEPYSELHPNEPIECFSSPGTISRRMTSFSLVAAACNKVLIELKRTVSSRIKYK